MTTGAFLLHEDREREMDGLRLALYSVRQCCPDAHIVVSAPRAPDALRAWIERLGNCTIVDWHDMATTGWNVKPTAILRALEKHDVVTWLDADIIFADDPRSRFQGEADVFVASEEPRRNWPQGSAVRVAGWGLSPGRPLARTVNSGVIRASVAHRGLLLDWAELLQRAEYRAAQNLPTSQRPLHMFSDQDALTALLGSASYADLPSHFLRTGVDIAQCGSPGSFTVSERLRSLRLGFPPIVHCMALRPWSAALSPRSLSLGGLRSEWRRWHIGLSPFTIIAGRYTEAADTEWQPITLNVDSNKRVSFADRYPQLPELPVTLIHEVVRSFLNQRQNTRLPPEARLGEDDPAHLERGL